MALDIEGFTRWLEGKRADVAAEEPPSIQHNISALSQRLWKAEQTLEQVRRLRDTYAQMRDDVLDGKGGPTQIGLGVLVNNLNRILDGGDA